MPTLVCGLWFVVCGSRLVVVVFTLWCSLSRHNSSHLPPPNRVPLDLHMLCAPTDVAPPDVTVCEYQPEFVGPEGWRAETVRLIEKHFPEADDDLGAYRKPPMFVGRCSRGGKSRALAEVCAMFKQRHPDCAVILISLNDTTTLQAWEHDDPVGAICRRIAFSAYKHRSTTTFRTFFEKYSVSEQLILKWLGAAGCMVGIDELNNLDAFQDSKGRSPFQCSSRRTFWRRPGAIRSSHRTWPRLEGS